MTYYFYQAVRDNEYQKVLTNLQSRATAKAIDIESELNYRFVQIRTVSHIFQTAQWVSFADFNHLIELVYKEFPDDRRLSWIARIPIDKQADFIEFIGQNPEPEYQNFEIFDFVDNKQTPTQGYNGEIVVVVYRYSPVKQAYYVGRSLTEKSPIMKTLGPALAANEPSIGPLTYLPQPMIQKPAFMIYLPVDNSHQQGRYSGIMISANYVASAFENTQFDKDEQAFNYRLTDHQQNVFLYPQNTLLDHDKPPPVSEVSKPNQRFTFPINIVNQTWQLELIPKQAIKPESSQLLNLLLGVGILSSFALALFVSYIAAKNTVLQNIVAKQTKKLRVSNKKLEDKNIALEEAIAKANAAVEAKASFLANMSHEIRTPMHGIIGLTHLCRKTPLTLQQEDYLQNIERSATHLTTVINDILDFTKIDSGKLELDEQPFSLLQVTQSVKAILSTTANDKGLSLDINIAPNVPIDLLGDSVRINQVLINLCANGLKFTQQGGITLDINAVPLNDKLSCADKGRCYYFTFTVKDTGIGIAEDKLDMLFNAFTQVDVSTSRNYGGTGLGLSISKMLCQLMGGKITVTSELGKGSCFSASFPLYTNDQIILHAPNEKQVFENKIKALAIDDNPIAQEIIEQQLGKMNINVDCGSSFEQGLSWLEAGKPYDLILLDWHLPTMNYSQFIDQINLNNIEIPPIIVLSGYSKEIVTQESTQHYLHCILQKPCTASELFEAIKTVFTQSNAEKTDPNLPLEQIKVLVAEDNIINQQVINEVLKQLGAEVTLVENGQVCVDWLRQHQDIDIVLMDIQMPIMDGLEATRVIRTQLQLTDLPIIAVTADALNDDLNRYTDAGMNTHLTKPLNVAELLTTIQSLLGR